MRYGGGNSDWFSVMHACMHLIKTNPPLGRFDGTSRPPPPPLVSPIEGKIRLSVRSPPRLLPGALALAAPPAGLHHLHHGGPLPAPPGDHAVPIHAHRHRAVDPQEGGRLLGPRHNEPQGDWQDLAVCYHPQCPLV